MYLDSAILVKLVVREPDSGFYADLVDGRTDLCSSELAVTECWSALLRKRQEGAVDSDTRLQAWERLERHWSRGGGLSLRPVDRGVLQQANRIMESVAPRAMLRTLDAVHMATCVLAAAYPLVTNDRVMRKAAAFLRIPLSPPV